MANRDFVKLDHISKVFIEKRGWLRSQGDKVIAVNDVSMTIESGKIVAFVGESGSGKTTLGRLICSLITPSSGTLVKTTEPQMIFQNPALSFNPRYRLLDALMEPLLYRGVDRKIAIDRVKDSVEAVSLSDEFLDRYPHQFSLGQKQRLAIARALIVDPTLVIADEIVSSLDLSIQSQILQLLLNLNEERGIGFVFISHDLACVRAISEYVYVFYKGKIVEEGPTSTVLVNPQHEYTKLLIANEHFSESKL